jgi:hypothetical protein
MTEVETSMARTAVRPFRINVSEEELVDLRRRILAPRWPDKETVADQSQGVPLATMQELARHWATEQTASRFCRRQCRCKSTVSDRHNPADLHRLAFTHSEPLFVRCGALMACRAEISDTVGFNPHQRKGNCDVVCSGFMRSKRTTRRPNHFETVVTSQGNCNESR